MASPFQILGISEKSSKNEVKSAFRKLAKKYHPDLNKSPDATLKFREINVAYNEAIQKAAERGTEAHTEAFGEKTVWATWTSGTVWVATIWLTQKEAIKGEKVRVRYQKKYGEGHSSFYMNIPAGVQDYQFLECDHGGNFFNFIIAIVS